jgi:ABC-type Zn2+ transport system substrate-binding protein/surface adhesin
MKFRLVTIIRDAVECGKVSFIEVHEPRGFGVTNDADHDHDHDDDHDHDHHHGDEDGADEDLNSMTVAELKERCKAAGLPVGGKKADLIARLSE